MYLFCGLLLLLPFGYGMKDGDSSEWGGHPYMVKILSHLGEEDGVIACTGTRVSASLIISASQCFPEEPEKLDAVVFSMRGNGTTAWKRKVIFIKLEGNFAVISIHRRLREEMCPFGISRLPLGRSLLESSWQPVSVDLLTDQSCRIVGFETNSVEEFSIRHILRLTDVTLGEDSGMVSAVMSDGRPCFDDVGLPLECDLDQFGGWTQVGLLLSIDRTANDEDDGNASNSTDTNCDGEKIARFAVFSDESMGKLLDPSSIEVFSNQAQCFH